MTNFPVVSRLTMRRILIWLMVFFLHALQHHLHIEAHLLVVSGSCIFPALKSFASGQSAGQAVMLITRTLTNASRHCLDNYILCQNSFFNGMRRRLHYGTIKKMPMVRVATNLPDKDVPANFEERLTDLLAESMNKPRARIAVEMMAGQRIMHGGVRNPVVLIKVESIGALDPDSTIRHTQRVTQLCTEVLHVPKDKVIISYFDLAPTNVGFAGTTVAAATV